MASDESMQRYFNTSGPCDPALHYTVLREPLIEKGRRKVEQGRFFTIFAPRQSGKTTYFQQLIKRLEGESLTPVWVSFENLKSATSQMFYLDFSRQLKRRIQALGTCLDLPITNPVELGMFFEDIRSVIPPLVLIIDEFEGVPGAVTSDLMHTFRKLYHQKEDNCLHSLLLVGVSTVAELVVSSASPFNIADELVLPYFMPEEVRDLIGQYETASGQPFEEEVVRNIYANTQGQPGLVCGLCRHLTEEVATDRRRPVGMADFYQTLKHYLTRKFDKNVLNIVQKAREKKDFMLQLLFGDAPIPFTVDDPDIAYLYAHGVVENVDDKVAITVPIYAKRLITAFQPRQNGETEHYVSAQDTPSQA